MMLVATKAFTYANVPLQPGDRFRAASEHDARLLKGFEKAVDADDDEPQQKRRYRRRDMLAEG